MENTLKISSATAGTGSGVLHLPGYSVFAVAAGADGSPSADSAVAVVIEALRAAFHPDDGSRPASSVEGRARLIRNAIRAAGEILLEQPEGQRGVATVAALVFDGTDSSRACVLNAGDCRCYRVRNGRAEQLTRSASAAENTEEMPLLLNVFNDAVGRNENVNIEEQYIQIESGDVFVLLPGLLLKEKPEQIIGRALRRAANENADGMADALVEEAAKAGVSEGEVVIVRAGAADVPAAGEISNEPPTDEQEQEAEAPSEVVEVSESMPEPTLAPDDSAGSPLPEESKTPIEADEEEPVRQLARKVVMADIAPEVEIPEPKSGLQMTRSPLLASGGEPPKASPWPAIAAIAATLLVLCGVVYWGVGWWRKHRTSDADQAMEQSAKAVDLVAQAKLTGKWGDLEKNLPKLPPLPPDDDATTRAWIALWRQAGGADFSDAGARAHLDTMDLLARMAGGTPAEPAAVWNAENRADIYCRLVFEKQQRLAESVEQMLQATDKRGDIPFPDRIAQEASLVGIGQFTRGRRAQTLDSIRGDLTVARIGEGQLDSWLNRREMERPQSETALQRIPGDSMRQLQTSLDRSWVSLFEIINGLPADIAYWRNQRSAAALAPRINRLDAVRKNVLADRQRYASIRQWRVSGNKQLAKWLIDETAALGGQLRQNRPATAR